MSASCLKLFVDEFSEHCEEGVLALFCPESVQSQRCCTLKTYFVKHSYFDF